MHTIYILNFRPYSFVFLITFTLAHRSRSLVISSHSPITRSLMRCFEKYKPNLFFSSLKSLILFHPMHTRESHDIGSPFLSTVRLLNLLNIYSNHCKVLCYRRLVISTGHNGKKTTTANERNERTN